MSLLCGWKEIAAYLHLTVRTAQRWEAVGLPVHRAYESRRSPVLAAQDELERWVHTRHTKEKKYASQSQRLLESRYAQLRATHLRAHRRRRSLLTQIGHLVREQKRLVDLIHSNLP